MVITMSVLKAIILIIIIYTMYIDIINTIEISPFAVCHTLSHIDHVTYDQLLNYI